MIRNRITSLLIAIVVLASPLPAFAGTTVAKIAQILLYDAGNLVYVYPAGGVQNPAPCQASNVTFYSFSLARPMGRQYLAALMGAQARNATVIFQGSGTCTDQAIAETLGVVVVITQP